MRLAEGEANPDFVIVRYVLSRQCPLEFVEFRVARKGSVTPGVTATRPDMVRIDLDGAPEAGARFIYLALEAKRTGEASVRLRVVGVEGDGGPV